MRPARERWTERGGWKERRRQLEAIRRGRRAYMRTHALTRTPGTRTRSKPAHERTLARPQHSTPHVRMYATARTHARSQSTRARTLCPAMRRSSRGQNAAASKGSGAGGARRDSRGRLSRAQLILRDQPRQAGQ